MPCDSNFDHVKSFVRTCFLASRRPSSLSSVCLCVCTAQNNEFLILLSCVCCRTSLIWILSKSPIPPFWVGFPLKVIVSLKPINAASFKTTFALLKKVVSAGGRESFQIKVCTIVFFKWKNAWCLETKQRKRLLGRITLHVHELGKHQPCMCGYIWQSWLSIGMF